MTAAERWASELAAWAIPDDIMAGAPESPWAFMPAVFRAPVDPGPDTASRRRAREALPDGGWVLDVGCGGGVAGLALVPPASGIIGFDPGADLLALFVERAGELGVAYEAVQGTWPADAGLVRPGDVVVCHHVAYNVPDLGAFAAALTTHAKVRVVMELTDEHPRAGLNHLWRHFWDIDRPTGPTGEDAIAVLVEAGFEPKIERSRRVSRATDRATRVASVRRYLCLPADRGPEVDAALGDDATPAGDVVTLWWEGTA